MAGVRTAKIRSGALLEVLVAISILVTVFATGTMIYLRVSSSTYTGEMIRADLLLYEVMEETVKSKAFFDVEEERGPLIVRKTVAQYEGNPRLLVIRLVAVNKQQKVLSEKKQLVLLNETQD